MSKNLIAISSPLQLINALEALEHFGLRSGDNHLIVRAVQDTDNATLIRDLLVQDEWASIYWYSSKSKFQTLPRLLSRFKGSEWDAVIGGELTAWWMNTLYANIRFEKQILVDDGTMTLADYDNFLLPGKLPEKRKGFKDLVLRLLGFRGMSFTLNRSVYLHTIFDLESTPLCLVSKNKMSLLKREIQNKHLIDTQGDILFIGQPLVGINMVTWEVYSNYLLAIRNRSPTGRILYCRHRHEDEKIIKKINQLDGIEVISSPYPLEIGFSRLDRPISMLVGFCSTALFTLSDFHQDLPVFFVEFKPGEYLSDDYRIKADNIYSNLATSIQRLEV